MTPYQKRELDFIDRHEDQIVSCKTPGAMLRYVYRHATQDALLRAEYALRERGEHAAAEVVRQLWVEEQV
jgi:hypothetical protein